MSVLLVVGNGKVEAEWFRAVAAALPDEQVVRPGDGFDPDAVAVALVAGPPAGALRGLRNLLLIQSLWAGVDGLLADPTLPASTPLARLVDPQLTASMSESVLLHVLWLHRQMPAYRRFQAERAWRPLPQPSAGERRVGVLGLGSLGRAACATLSGLGFAVSGWSRTEQDLAGVRCLSGPAGLAALLDGCEILVNLLPLTAETGSVLSAGLFARLARGAGVINMGRGRHLMEADLLAALDAGQVGHAVLDVLTVEPAPPEHPFWTHPRITLTPHVAASSDPRTASAIAAEAVRAVRNGRPVAGLVSRARGY